MIRQFFTNLEKWSISWNWFTIQRFQMAWYNNQSRDIEWQNIRTWPLWSRQHKDDETQSGQPNSNPFSKPGNRIRIYEVFSAKGRILDISSTKLVIYGRKLQDVEKLSLADFSIIILRSSFLCSSIWLFSLISKNFLVFNESIKSSICFIISCISKWKIEMNYYFVI